MNDLKDARCQHINKLLCTLSRAAFSVQHARLQAPASWKQPGPMKQLIHSSILSEIEPTADIWKMLHHHADTPPPPHTLTRTKCTFSRQSVVPMCFDGEKDVSAGRLKHLAENFSLHTWFTLLSIIY